MGDIGELFPDSDPQFAGADSMVLLSDVAHRVRRGGQRIVDVDVTVAAEAPKLMPHRLAMRENLSSAMGVGVESVGLKATTTEGLEVLRGRGPCPQRTAEDGAARERTWNGHEARHVRVVRIREARGWP